MREKPMKYPPTPKAQLDARYESQRQRTNLHLSTQDTCFDPNNFHHRFRLFGYEKLREFLNSLRETLDNKSVVVLGCGKGFDFHLIKYFFRNVDLAGVDISETALELVKKSFPNVRSFLGNMESLEFEDGAFDYAIVPVALHHLQSVYRGVYEAIRISRKGALLMEPYDSPLARLATRLGYATEYEEVGNYVFRTSIREMKKVGKAIFMDVQAKPYMYVHYTAKTSLDYNIWRGLNALADLAAPWVANECIVYFRKEHKIGPKNHS
jgi:ubiquinone/menaquinone biosynthesis C-methylase UbiE